MPHLELTPPIWTGPISSLPLRVRCNPLETVQPIRVPTRPAYDVKPATREVWKQPIRNLIAHFGVKKDITKISEADAMDFRQYLMNSKLASATVAKRLQFARTFFHDARRRKLIASNPFAEVSAKSVVRLDQR